MRGENVPLNLRNTLEKEQRRRPEHVFRVNIPNGRGFDAAVSALRGMTNWFCISGLATGTNCVHAASLALQAGGFFGGLTRLSKRLVSWKRS